MLTAVSAAVTKVEHLYVIKFFQARATFPLLAHPTRLLTDSYAVRAPTGNGRGFNLCWRGEFPSVYRTGYKCSRSRVYHSTI